MRYEENGKDEPLRYEEDESVQSMRYEENGKDEPLRYEEDESVQSMFHETWALIAGGHDEANTNISCCGTGFVCDTGSACICRQSL